MEYDLFIYTDFLYSVVYVMKGGRAALFFFFRDHVFSGGQDCDNRLAESDEPIRPLRAEAKTG